MHTGLWWGGLRKREHFEDLGLDGRIILKLKFKLWDGQAGTSSDLVPDREKCRALVNVVINLRVPYNAGNFLKT